MITVTHDGHTGELIYSNAMRGLVCSVCGKASPLYTDRIRREAEIAASAE